MMPAWGKVRLHWTATSQLSGTVAKLGAKLLEGVARKMTEQFWDDFARRVGQEEAMVRA
jgi:carbon monoxide dehydrogenase subunit G